MRLKDIPFVHQLGLKVKHGYWMKKTRKQVKLYLQGEGEKKLQLGAGQNKLSNWFNTDYFPRPDIFFLDVTKKIPAPANSFDYVFSEHHIEHIHYNDAKFMVSEILRVLKPGGVFRVCTPSLNAYLKSYFEEEPLNNPFVTQTLNDWIKSGFYNARNYAPTGKEENVAFFINDIFLNYDHKFIFDDKTLGELLLNAGFSRAATSVAGASAISAFQKIEAHPSNHYTLVVEGVK